MTGSEAPSVTRLWPTHARPAIEADDPPCYRNEYPFLAEMAVQMLDARRARFPGLVAANKLDQAEADREIALVEQIARHWRWMITGDGEPAPRTTILDRCEVLDRSLLTIADIAGMRGGFDADLAHQTQCVIAMRWHADRTREHCVVAVRNVHHQALQRTATGTKEGPAHVQ